MYAFKRLRDGLARTRSRCRQLSPAWLQGCLLFLVLFYLMGAWVHWSFQGHWWGPFLPGAQFGVPEAVDAEFEIFATTHTGWDGQFYFYQANDVLALADTAEHVDNPAYRYQRIGAPLLARLVAWVMGNALVPAWVYHLTQIAIVAIGYGFLVSWLRRCGHSSLWALAWVCSDGVVNALAFGMPDPVGDGLFIIAAVGFLTNRLWVFLPAALFLPLVREAYALICGLIALATALGLVGWGAEKGSGPVGRLMKSWLPTSVLDKLTVDNAAEANGFRKLVSTTCFGRFRTRWRDVVLVATPCFVVVGWQAYVTQRFGISPSKAGGGVMLDYPFFGWWDGLKMVIDRNNYFEVVLHFFTLALIVLTIATVWEQRRKSLLAYFSIPYLILLVCMSWVAWEDFSGYMKAAGTVIVMLLLFLPKHAGALRYAFLIFLIAEGLVMGYKRKVPMLFSPYSEVVIAQEADGDTGGVMTGRLEDFGARIEVLNEAAIAENSKADYTGLWKSFHRRLGTVIQVRVTNTSESVWKPSPATGMNAVNLSFQWLDAKSGEVVLETSRIPIGQRMAPGDTRDFEMTLAYPGAGEYILHISMIQEGHLWFHHVCEQYQLRLDID